MAYNDILEELRAKLSDDPDANEKLLKEQGENFAKEGNYDGLKAVGELLMDNMPEERRKEIDRLTHIDGMRLDEIYAKIEKFIQENNYLEAIPLAERLYKKVTVEYADGENARFVSLRNPFEDNLCQLLFNDGKTLNRTPFNFTMYLTTYAFLLVETGANVDAIPILEDAIEYNPVDVGPRFELAEVYKLLKNKRMTLETSRETLKCASSPVAIARVYANVGYILTDMGEYDDAVAFYTASLIFAPHPAIQYELRDIANRKGSHITKPSHEQMVEALKKYDFEFGPNEDVISVAAQLSANYLIEQDIPNALKALKIVYNLTLDEEIKKLILKYDPESKMLRPEEAPQTDFDPQKEEEKKS